MQDIVERLLLRGASRSEANIQADIRQFILTAPFELDEDQVVNLEVPVGDRRRIDIEAGATVIEVKRDLRRGRVREEARAQLAGYVAARGELTGQRYVGVLTDGVEWTCYNLQEDALQPVTEFVLTAAADTERLMIWLEGVLATTRAVRPLAHSIQERLGARSSAYALDHASLATLYTSHSLTPSVKMKRQLWSRLLTSALGTQFIDSDELFIEHTLLVNSAEIIAHAVLGLDVQTIAPEALLSGQRFDESGIYGVVEPDFFDWVIEIEGGAAFIRTLARRLARFDWSSVEQDILKVLYESIIGAETRKQLGEYYTPDWLAEGIIAHVNDEPLTTRVLDAACGSGTFLFHAVRAYISAAERAGHRLPEILEGVTRHVLGMDLHPVAVTLARVTYILAIGRARLLDASRETIQIPVYLGDSLQWQEQNTNLWSAGNLVIHADDNRELFPSELRFPAALLENAGRFDQLVNEMANRASSRERESGTPSIRNLFQRLAIEDEYRPALEATFKTMCRLHDEGRNHIWAYYVRNLSRPMWLAREGNKVDLLVGNPPWLAYRFMTPAMQSTFRDLSTARGLWAGAQLSSHQDLSGLFVVRACELYLRSGGRFAMVLPNAAIDRAHYESFRTGSYGDASGGLTLEFFKPWDLRRIRPHIFPRAASVAFGKKSSSPEPMPIATVKWTGQVPQPTETWATLQEILQSSAGSARRLTGADRSAYHQLFSQGAVLLPRLVFMVEERQVEALGLPAGRAAICSHRSNNEKKPWKFLGNLAGVIETEFLRPVHTGETLLPYRMATPLRAVLPCNAQRPLTPDQIEGYRDLDRWWVRASQIWEDNRSSDKLTLMQQLDFQGKLTRQLPIPELRVVYNRSGMHVVGAKINDRRAIVSSGLYWMPSYSEAEADYLCAILNSATITETVRPLMSYGKDERDIAKHIWELPIPRYDLANEQHRRISEIGAQLVNVVAEIALAEGRHFASIRRDIREALQNRDDAQEADELVYEMLG